MKYSNYYANLRAALIPLILTFFLFPFPGQAKEYKGRVVGVSDGDTITVLHSGNQQIKVRLAEIDTPESSQPYGKRAKQNLSDLVFNKTVIVKVKGTDRYGRLIGRVIVNGVDINARMVELGAAWVYRKYAKDQNLFVLEERARKYKIGLWGLPEADRVPPWEWRRRKRGNNKIENNITANLEAQFISTKTDLACGRKRYCNQMTSCKEAMHYLKQCGLSRLDRDGDGVPCESICR